jgi:hypothetical protein
MPVFFNLDYRSQICLGLTCKSFAATLETVGLNSPSNQSVDFHYNCEGGELELKKQLGEWLSKTHKFCAKCRKHVRMEGDRWKDTTHFTSRLLAKNSKRIVFEQMKSDKLAD